jgi:hypothetical protein
MKLEFSRQIFEKYSDIKFHKTPVAAELFHADRQADMTKQIVAFCNFANAPKTDYIDLCVLLIGHYKEWPQRILHFQNHTATNAAY